VRTVTRVTLGEHVRLAHKIVIQPSELKTFR